MCVVGGVTTTYGSGEALSLGTRVGVGDGVLGASPPAVPPAGSGEQGGDASGGVWAAGSWVVLLRTGEGADELHPQRRLVLAAGDDEPQRGVQRLLLQSAGVVRGLPALGDGGRSECAMRVFLTNMRIAVQLVQLHLHVLAAVRGAQDHQHRAIAVGVGAGEAAALPGLAEEAQRNGTLHSLLLALIILANAAHVKTFLQRSGGKRKRSRELNVAIPTGNRGEVDVLTVGAHGTHDELRIDLLAPRTCQIDHPPINAFLQNRVELRNHDRTYGKRLYGPRG